MAKKVLVTSALPYANGPIHVGHLVEYIQTDIFARFLKLTGKDAIYVCAEDTHGTPIEVNAKKAGVKPEEFIKKWKKEHLEDFKSFLIEFDSYYSTNSPENKKFAEHFFSTLKEKGLIYTLKIKVMFCEKCKRNLPDRFVKGTCPKCGAEDQYGDICEKCGEKYEPTDLINPKCTICREKPVLKDSEHYFFKLSKLSGKLEKWLKENKNLQPEIRNYVLNWIKEGLMDWDISRDGPYFGFKIPGEKDKYFYVWLDAPIGYISSTENYCKSRKCDVLKDYWQSKDCDIIHFIGKDIIYFHFLFWPAMLMSVDFNLPKNLVVHGFLTVNKEKMSKSKGTYFTAKDFLKKYPNPEYLRFYYARLLSRKMSDLDLNLDLFKEEVNNELVANISNFLYRVLSFAEKKLKAGVKDFDDDKVIKQIEKRFDIIKKAYEDYNFKKALSEILAVSSLGNSYFQNKEPWKADEEEAGKIICLCANIIKNLAILIKPILPDFAKGIEKQLNLKDLKWKDLGFDYKNKKLGKAEILVKKIE